ncbi:RNA polymerase subunit sigma-70 [Halovulum dunhuangense]|uniref:RNA polymerase subunit sigma-70 n=1 Tax=Halovulum dunhuangense TaxID=1505036 RepID=A0A849L428_9RHOB|nr:RNA polymerase subunit sigma-70 [Halovulum dunhuangense]NNU81089.1 RNA polymerase subunit sigma-70 [Halovulum dunhuangense]
MKQEIEFQMARNIRRIARMDIPGGGQVVVQGQYAYVGHMKPPHGTSVIDVSDPANPRVVAHIDPPAWSHTHKVRVAGKLMVTNVEQDRRHFLRKGARIEGIRAELGAGASDADVAAKLGVKPEDIPVLEEAHARGYDNGGFRVWDISDPTAPKLLSYVKTHGFGVHRFDMDENYAYISTEMEGYVGNILVVYDLSDPTNPTEVSRWHMKGQHVGGGETPTWTGYGRRLHHAMRCGDEFWAAVMHAGVRVLDASDIRNLREVGTYEWPPAIPEPTHTVMPFEKLIDGRRYALAVDEEHDHLPGRLHGFLWVMDVTDLSNMVPVAAWDLSERASPWAGQKGVRFGAHQFREKLDSHLVYLTWFAGGLRVLDVSNPKLPVEVAHFIPGPGPDGSPPQSNDVTLDDRGLIYVIDRTGGLDILEMTV